ncbi:MAG: 3D domain-containing protein [Lysobacterales bacterium]
MQDHQNTEDSEPSGRNGGINPAFLTPAKAAAGGALCLALVVIATSMGSDTWKTLEVTASAYNSLPEQTSKVEPDIAAWGDQLVPGMKAIAVSRDLLELGFKRGTRVTIDGLPGEWKVLDKMNRRWSRHIDIYMGEDVKAAKLWGRKDVTIRWLPEEES